MLYLPVLILEDRINSISIFNVHINISDVSLIFFICTIDLGSVESSVYLHNKRESLLNNINKNTLEKNYDSYTSKI